MSRSDPSAQWQSMGFGAPPKQVVGAGGERLFRVWGGTTTREGSYDSAWVFFSPQCPASRREAERLFSVMEWGNSCRTVTEFLVPPGLKLWAGPVDPGTPIGSDWYCSHGIQVVVARADCQSLAVLREWDLVDDMRGLSVAGHGRGGRA